MNKSILQLRENGKEFYGVKNDKCPICDKKFQFVVPIVKVDGKAYHLTCYEKLMRINK